MVTINSHDDATYNTDWGIQYDTYLDSGSALTTFYNSTILVVGDDNSGGDPDYNTIFEISMPNEPMDGAEITGMTLTLTMYQMTSHVLTPTTGAVIFFRDLLADYTHAAATWTNRKVGVPWATGGGDFSDDYAEVISSNGWQYQWLTANPEVIFDLKDYDIDWGETKNCVLTPKESQDADFSTSLFSNRYGTDGYKPKLTITYTLPTPEAFEGDSDTLKVEPNPENRAQGKLSWGGSDDKDFMRYKLWRWKSGAAERSTLLTTITDRGNKEYIDTLSTTTDAVYYYQAGLSLQDDYDNIVSTLSSAVQFWRPKASTFTVTSTSPSAWSLVTGTITGAVTAKPSARTTIKYIYDWEGDATANQIRTLETHAASDSTTHAYTSAGARTPRAKIEDNLGFQSDYTVAAAVTVAGLSPIGVIKGPTYCEKSVNYYFRSDESYDQNTDGTLTSYAWDYSLITSFTSNLATTAPVISIAWSYTGSKTLAMKARDNESNQSESVIWTVTVYEDTETVLEFDESVTRISATNIDDGESVYAKNMYLGANYGEMIWTGKDFPTVSLRGWSKGADGRTDVQTLLGYSDTPTKLKIWVSENKLWYKGYLTNMAVDYRGGEIDQYYWNANFDVEVKEA